MTRLYRLANDVAIGVLIVSPLLAALLLAYYSGALA